MKILMLAVSILLFLWKFSIHSTVVKCANLVPAQVSTPDLNHTSSNAIAASNATSFKECRHNAKDNQPESKYIRLDNDLSIHLTSDPNASKSKTVLRLKVGANYDPLELQGASHFIEHLLFLGTKKYPRVNEYMEFIMRHQGTTNAVTDSFNVIYHFSIHSDFLYEALDRFAQFFISPLFAKEVVENEAYIVDSEFKSNLMDDQHRLVEIFKLFSNRKHPSSKFLCGNLETLKHEPEARGINVSARLIQFYERYYSANLMELEIIGKESLDTLENWLHHFFSPIQNRKTEIPYSQILSSPWDGLALDEIRQYVRVKSFKNWNVLILRWFIPLNETFAFRQIQKFSEYSGEGSLLWKFKSKDWATNFKVASNIEGYYLESFMISVELTEIGLERIDDIVVMVFQYLRFLVDAETPMFSKARKQASEECGHFQGKRRRKRDSSSGGSELPLSRVVANSILHTMKNASRRNAFHAWIPPFQMYLLTKEFQNVTSSSTEPIFRTEYAAEPIARSLIQRIEATMLDHSGFYFPAEKPNRFIPKKVSFKENSSREEIPKKYFESNNRRYWHLRDPTFCIPESYISIAFQSPLISKSALYRAFSDLLDAYLDDEMTETYFEASRAGIRVESTLDDFKFGLNIYGICDKCDLIVREFGDAMLKLRNIRTRFDRLKKNLLRDYENWNLEQPNLLTLARLRKGIETDYFLPSERMEALLPCTLEMFVEFTKELYTSFFIASLYVGHERAETIFLKLNASLQSFPGTFSFPSKNEAAIFLPPSLNLRFKERGKHLVEGAALYFIPICNASDYDTRSKLGIFDTMTREAVFHRLRTVDLLGYNVDSGLLQINKIFGFYIVVQGEKPTEVMVTRIEQCLVGFHEFLANMESFIFRFYRNSYIQEISEKPKTLLEIGDNFAGMIFNANDNFQAMEKLAHSATKHKLSSILDFYLKYIDPASQFSRRIIVEYLSAKEASDYFNVF